ncbi:MAG: TatD family hydrolase [Planctomycetes bacterium]|nr:TatD family hydrolase [Planctomycetota bacterium]
MHSETAKLIDTHCHLTDNRLSRDLEGVLERARDAGVVAIISATADVADSIKASQLAEKYKQIYCTAGVHPHESGKVSKDYLNRLEELIKNPRCVAIGEIGLDYHYDFSPHDAQQRVFAEQLTLARRYGKPVVIHTREAFDDTLAIISESGISGEQIIFHSFTGGQEQARRVLQIGAYISFSGILTFKNADAIRSTAVLVPDDKILIETDAPYLSPEPIRKMKVNEPANITYIAEFLARIRKIGVKQVAEQTTVNALKIFSLDIDMREDVSSEYG